MQEKVINKTKQSAIIYLLTGIVINISWLFLIASLDLISEDFPGKYFSIQILPLTYLLSALLYNIFKPLLVNFICFTKC